MEPEPATEGQVPPGRGLLATLVVGAVSATLCCAAGAVGVVLRDPLRVALSTLDGRLVLRVDSADPAVATQAWKVLRRRLKSADLPGRLSSGEGGRIVVEHRAQDADAVRALATTRGELRFMLVVDGLSEQERRYLLVHLVSVRRPDGSLPDDEPLDVLSLDGELLALERPGIGGPGTFSGASRRLDDQGRPAFGFELTDAAAEQFRAFTSANVDRRLAIVMDGEVRSAPVIRGPIGAKGIVEGGAGGWDEAELARLVAVFAADPLPARLIPVSGE